jgi:glutathione S-transferase
MIELRQFAPKFGIPNPSPFCLKTETVLKMAGLPYKVVTVSNVSSQPKGKAPVMVDEMQVIPDSTFIIEHLKTRYGVDLDRDLSDEQKAISHMVRVSLEERAYWTLVYSRWVDEENWLKIKEAFFGEVPRLIRNMVAKKAREYMRKCFWSQGMGRHSSEEVYQLGIADIRALATMLGNKPYFMGDKPTLLDATAYGFLANVLTPAFDSPLREEANRQANLVAFTERMAGQYFSEQKAA